MTLHQLEIWITVANHLSITKAAHELHIRQPSVTQQIKLLEREYRLKFYKVLGGRGIELTPKGRILLKYAKKTLLQVENLKKELKSSSKPRRRHR